MLFLRRVCAAWGLARSSFYMTCQKALLVAIPGGIALGGRGLPQGRVCRDIRVARKRVLRLMRENNLLSPHRCRRRGGNPHDGESKVEK